MPELNVRYFSSRDRTTMPTSTYGAFCKLRKVILFVIDPYVDGSIYQALGTLTATPDERENPNVQTSGRFCAGNAEIRPTTYRIYVEVRATRDFHDRFIILDRTDAICLVLPSRTQAIRDLPLSRCRNQVLFGLFWIMLLRYGHQPRHCRQCRRRGVMSKRPHI